MNAYFAITILAIVLGFNPALSRTFEDASDNRAAYRKNVAHAKDFGAVGDGKVDDWFALQKGIESLSLRGGGTLIIDKTEANAYVIGQALRMRSSVSISVPDNDTTIRCVGQYKNKTSSADETGIPISVVSTWPFCSCVIFGSMVSAENTNTEAFIVATGDKQRPNTLHIKNESDVDALQAGDAILIEDQNVYDINGQYIPVWGEMNSVNKIDKIERNIHLKYKISNQPENLRLRVLSRTKKDFTLSGKDLGKSIPLLQWTSENVSIKGGNWIAKSLEGVYLPFSVGGGALNCEIDLARLTAGWGLGYGNLFSRCRMHAREQTVYGPALELAYVSTNNVVTLNSLTAGKTARAVPWLLAIDESSHSNVIKIESIKFLDSKFDNAINLFSSSNNKIFVKNAAFDGMAGSHIRMYTPKYRGHPSKTENNIIRICTDFPLKKIKLNIAAPEVDKNFIEISSRSPEAETYKMEKSNVLRFGSARNGNLVNMNCDR